MTAPINCIGSKFGKLTVIAEADPKIRKDRKTTIRRALCGCECGAETIVAVADLRSGNTLSCGCHRIAATIKANTTHGATRGLSKGIPATVEYHSWSGMIARCENEKHISYEYYGARGIKVCERWRNSFPNFLADMGEKPSKEHSIDRIDVDGDYAPGNCRWATGKGQFENSRVSPEFSSYINRGQGGGVWIAPAFRANDGID